MCLGAKTLQQSALRIKIKRFYNLCFSINPGVRNKILEVDAKVMIMLGGRLQWVSASNLITQDIRFGPIFLTANNKVFDIISLVQFKQISQPQPAAILSNFLEETRKNSLKYQMYSLFMDVLWCFLLAGCDVLYFENIKITINMNRHIDVGFVVQRNDKYCAAKIGFV